jgi:uracil-DNA glycosylase
MTCLDGRRRLANATTRLVERMRCAEAQLGMENNQKITLGGPYRVHTRRKDKTYKLTSHALDARCLVGRKSARFCRNEVVVTMGAFAGLYLLKLKCAAALAAAVEDAGPCPCCPGCPGGGDCDCEVE